MAIKTKVTKPTPTPTGGADQWNSTPGQSNTGNNGVNLSEVPPAIGRIYVKGFGSTKQAWTGGKPIMSYEDARMKKGSSSELKSLFESMVYNKDPRIPALMKQLGITDLKTMRSLWNKAATTAASIADSGQQVDFFQVMMGPSVLSQFVKTAGGGGGSTVQKTQYYTTNYFNAKGQPNAAANQLLKDALTKALGRTPSAAELKEYKPLLNQMRLQQQHGLFTDSYNPNTGVKTPGMDPATWLAEQVTNKHQARIQYGKESAQQTGIDQFKQLAAEYGYDATTPDGKALNQNALLMLSKIEAGKMTMDDAKEQFRVAALAQYAHLKPLFDTGLSLQQIANPALSAISSILEKDPNAISMNDPLIRQYLTGDGKSTMALSKFESLLKQKPEWQYTKNAHQQFSDLAMQLGQRFGMVG